MSSGCNRLPFTNTWSTHKCKIKWDPTLKCWVQHLAHKKHWTEIHFRSIIKREGRSFYIQRLEKQFLPLTNITNKGQWSLLCACVCWGDNLRCKLYCYCWLFSSIITCVYNQVNSGKPLTRTFFKKKKKKSFLRGLVDSNKEIRIFLKQCSRQAHFTIFQSLMSPPRENELNCSRARDGH